MIILIMAWRNIWRNTTRSMLIMTAIVLGIIAALFLDAFVTGLMRSFVDNGINKITSHIQVHAPGFLNDEDVKKTIEGAEAIISYAKMVPEVVGASPRSVVNAILSTSRHTRGVIVKGIDRDLEREVCDLSQLIKQGSYFHEEVKNGLLMGRPLAEELGIKIGNRVVLSFQDITGHITYGLFRVRGIFSTGNNTYDEAHVFVQLGELKKNMLANESDSLAVIHEIAILLNDIDRARAIQANLMKTFPAADVQNYGQIAPELELYESQMDVVSWIYFIIIMAALIFGIINTMLMAVLDRYREFGVLQAIGLGRWQTFLMVLVETLMICLLAIPLGMAVGYLIISYFSNTPIDLSLWAQMLEEYGMATEVFLRTNPVSFIRLSIVLAITAILASIYPAWKAMALNPLEAINKI